MMQNTQHLRVLFFIQHNKLAQPLQNAGRSVEYFPEQHNSHTRKPKSTEIYRSGKLLLVFIFAHIHMQTHTYIQNSLCVCTTQRGWGGSFRVYKARYITRCFMRLGTHTHTHSSSSRATTRRLSPPHSRVYDGGDSAASIPSMRVDVVRWLREEAYQC